MKKIVSILISIIFLFNIGLAYTSTIIVKGVSIKVSSEEGSIVDLEARVPEVTGWEVKSGNTTITNNQFVMPAGDVVIEGIIPATKYLLTIDLPDFVSEEERLAGEVITVQALDETDDYVFSSWTATGIELTESQLVSATITFTMPENAVTLVANYVEEVEWAGWNAPVLGTGLTPVNWNGSSWVETTEENWEYNYEIATAGHETVAGDGTGKWANAQTSDGSLYVWIPRYTYQITSGYHTSGDSWSSVDSAGTNKIEIKFTEGTEDEVTEGATNASEGYIAHPAFTFGTDELKGIWVAKYEASRNDATESSAGSGTTVSFKPGVISWRSLSVSNMYDYSYNLNRDLDSHLMKNSEWGAVAYLTNAIGKIPYINNSSSYITGNAGGSQNASYASGTTNAWNTASGVKASTTHNVYGIYDLSGGSWEYVSAYYEGGDSTYLANDTTNKTYAGSLYTNKDTKYVEVYPTTEDDAAYSADITGDAVYETSDDAYGTSWDGDYSFAPLSNSPVFERGGYCCNASYAGVFCFRYNDGNAYSDSGFRAVLSPETGGTTPTPATYTVTFDANSGSGTMNPQTFTEGVAQNLNTNTFTRDGYTFLGWSEDSGATTATYTNGQSYTAAGNTTLYAVWGRETYTISYNLDGGTVTGNPETYNLDTETITLINPTKNGYTFKGWTGSNGNTPSTTVTIPKGSTGNKTYTANWELKTYTVTITGTGEANNYSEYCYIGIDNNTNYASATTISVAPGTSMYALITYTSTITCNGQSVGGWVEDYWVYNFTITADTNIVLDKTRRKITITY